MSSTALRKIGDNPTIQGYAQAASQKAIMERAKVSAFLAPTAPVPTLTGKYKIYSAKHRYALPETKRGPNGRATRIGFTADDANYDLVPHALDFPIPNTMAQNASSVEDIGRFGADLLAEAAALAEEFETVQKALDTLGGGTDQNFTAANFDPIDFLDGHITNVMKAAKNGAPIRVLFGMTAWKRTKNHAETRARFNGVAKITKTPDLSDISAMLLGRPEVQVATLVYDAAKEGAAENINFILDNAIIVFAANATPTTMDPSFMKTFRLMGQYMRPGVYQSEDERDDVLKMDWVQQVVVTNSAAAVRLNANAS